MQEIHRYTSRWLGLVDYEAAWSLQKSLIPELLTKKAAILIGCEHPLVITHGRSVELQKSSATTPRGAIPEVYTDRGGLSTVHNPGQLMIYPLCNIKNNGITVREWVEFLLEVTKLCLEKCNIIIIAKNNGVFTSSGKIASIGLKINKGISTHGIAINTSNDLKDFSSISPCGVRNQSMDKAQNYDSELTTERVFALWLRVFHQQFHQTWPQGGDYQLADPEFHY